MSKINNSLKTIIFIDFFYEFLSNNIFPFSMLYLFLCECKIILVNREIRIRFKIIYLTNIFNLLVYIVNIILQIYFKNNK